MKSMRQLTAIIEREDDAYVALCPELDIASQGETVEAARMNLIEALEWFFESADPTEIARRLHNEMFVTRVEVAVGHRQTSVLRSSGREYVATAPGLHLTASGHTDQA